MCHPNARALPVQLQHVGKALQVRHLARVETEKCARLRVGRVVAVRALERPFVVVAENRELARAGVNPVDRLGGTGSVHDVIAGGNHLRVFPAGGNNPVQHGQRLGERMDVAHDEQPLNRYVYFKRFRSHCADLRWHDSRSHLVRHLVSEVNRPALTPGPGGRTMCGR